MINQTVIEDPVNLMNPKPDKLLYILKIQSIIWVAEAVVVKQFLNPGLLWGLNEIMLTKYLAQCLAQIKC